MTPKEKALEIVSDFFINGSPKNSYYTLSKDVSKSCAKVAANEILKQYSTLNSELIDIFYMNEKMEYWKEVIKEIDYV